MPDENGIPVRHQHDCGECGMCLVADYESDNPDTHCIDCTCLFCIPGG